MPDVIAAIDAGSVHQGLAYYNEVSGTFGWFYLPLPRDLTYDEFARRINSCKGLEIMISTVKFTESAALIIERANHRSQIVKIRQGRDKKEERRQHSRVANFWRKYFLDVNPNIQITRVDAFKWQTRLLGSFSTVGRSRYSKLAIDYAESLTGQIAINEHIADAICLVEYGRTIEFPAS